MGIVRVMAGTQCVEIVAFHEEDVCHHAFQGDGFAIDWMCVVSVCAFEHDAFAVDIYASVSVFNLSESIFLCVNVATYGNVYGVEVRRFCCPEFWIRHFKVEATGLDTFFYVCDLQDCSLNGFACGVYKFDINAGICFFAIVL